ncbi:Major royal jelly protein [compost metagenome]
MHTSMPLIRKCLATTLISALAMLCGSAYAITSAADKAAQPQAAAVDIVAELPMRPGNVAATKEGRIFATVHPLGKPSGLQLIEITGKKSFVAWPGKQYQNDGVHFTEDRIDTPLGIYRDKHNNLWIIDMGLHLGKTRAWGFNIASGKLLKRYDLAADIAPKGSFVQDLVVDEERGWMYLADIANPGLIALDMKTGQAHRFSNHPALQAEPDAKMIIDGKQILFQGKPAEVAVNPISLSADGETLYFGAMNGRSWYSLPARRLRNGASDAVIGAAISRVGAKPISDGAAIDAYGNHYFTNVTERGIDVLDTNGVLRPFVRDARMIWPDGLQFGAPDALYLSVNQLYKAAGFTGGEEQGKPPFYIFKIRTRYTAAN